MKYQKENQVVQGVAKKVVTLQRKYFGRVIPVDEKTAYSDVVSFLDTETDSLIVRELAKTFKGDLIISEESSPGLLKKSDKRSWVIDPLCGSFNVSRGIKFFATNLALLENNKVVAAWVVDHAQDRVLWSIGGGKVYSGIIKLPRLKATDITPLVEIDRGYFAPLGRKIRENYANMEKELTLNRNFIRRNFASSLTFAYVATGQYQVVTSINVEPWDLLAAVFLVVQNGGVVTNFDGSPWTLESRSLVFAGDKKMHSTMLRLLKKHKLNKVK